MNAKRLTAALLALVLLTGLAGCGENEQKKVENLVFRTSPYYIQEDVPTAAATGELADCCTDRQSIWYLSTPAEGAEPVLCRVPLDGAASEILPEYQPPTEGDPSMRVCWGPFMGGDGKLWIWERLAVREGVNPETGEYTGFQEMYHMRQLDPDTGRELLVVDITGAMESMDYNSLNGLAVDGTGTIFMADKKHVAAIDSQGQTLYTLKGTIPNSISSGAGGSLALLPDGTVGVLTSSAKSREVRIIDPNTKDWTGEKYSLHDDVGQIYSGSGTCAFYYIYSNTVYGVIFGEEVPLRLLSWSDAQLDSPNSVRCFVLWEDGQAAIFSDIHDPGTGKYDNRLLAARLLPTDEPPPGSRIKLVYGTIGFNSSNCMMDERVIKFNRSSAEYRVEIRDYAEGMLGWGDRNSPIYYNALSRLYADIAAGQGPDILDGTIPLDGLARQGGMEDLWTWIDGDPDISREGLMDHVLECMEVDGMLPRVCSGFSIETAVASAEVAGDRTGWTMEEMRSAFGGEMPAFYMGTIGGGDVVGYRTVFSRFDKRSTLYNLINMNLDSYVDWETGACSFDGEDFKSLLQLVGSMGEVENGLNLDAEHVSYDWGLPAGLDAAEPCQVFPWQDQPLLYTRTLSEPTDLVIDDVLFGGREVLTDYEQRLWDAGLLYHASTKTGVEHDFLLYETSGTTTYLRDWWLNGYTSLWYPLAHRENQSVAADCAVGGADGKVYASYVGLPSAGGAGSSFTLYDCMGISAASKAKEGAWAFVRGLLLPGGNAVDWVSLDVSVPPEMNGFSMDRATFEQQMARKDWTDPFTGEVFRDANGDAVEFTPSATLVGRPGDIVLMAYLFSPTEAQMERFWKLYNATDHITSKDDALVDVILDQADAYFAGDKSLDETARLIQNRAKLYVNEQR